MSLNLIANINTDKYEYKLTCIDSHTQGEALRLVVGGLPDIPGNTMMERLHYFENNYDFIRTALMDEPRGHGDMFGAVLTEPIHEEADYGIFFMNADGYIEMCGHGSIAASTDLVEAGLVKVTEPYTDVKFDTGAGVVTCHVRVENGKAIEVELNNVPAFVYREGLTTCIDGKE
mgnify:CR=1 FL=1